MPKIKEPANYSHVMTDTKASLTAGCVKKILVKHKIQLSNINSNREPRERYETIARKVNEAIEQYESLKDYDRNKPRLKNQKKYLDELLKATQHLEHLLKNTGYDISMRLIRTTPIKTNKNTTQPAANSTRNASQTNPEKTNTSIVSAPDACQTETTETSFELVENLKANLEQFCRLTQITKREIPKDKGGHSRDAIHHLIWLFADIFESETEDTAKALHTSALKCTAGNKNKYSESFKSGFLNFISDVVESIKPINTINLPCGKTIRATLDRKLKQKLPL